MNVTITTAEKHYGTAVFLDKNGKQRIAALWANYGQLTGWRLPEMDIFI